MATALPQHAGVKQRSWDQSPAGVCPFTRATSTRQRLSELARHRHGAHASPERPAELAAAARDPYGRPPPGEDNLFLTSLGASAQPAYPYQQMPQELQLPSLPLNGPHAGAPARDMPGMPLWTQAPLSSPLLKEDDLGGFVPVPSGQPLSPALPMASI